jgi:hypothetical protein
MARAVAACRGVKMKCYYMPVDNLSLIIAYT